MNKTQIEWVKNPDGTPGYTWNPITGCLNHDNGKCKGGGFPCYAYRLANGRLRTRYLANEKVASDFIPIDYDGMRELMQRRQDPFYPRFWLGRLKELEDRHTNNNLHHKPIGVFVCDMSDLFGVGVPDEWTKKVLDVISSQMTYPALNDHFYLLTKQPQNLIKFSPFPNNCWVGVTVCNYSMANQARYWLGKIEARVKYLSIEPFLEPLRDRLNCLLQLDFQLDWVIIGAQTKPYKPPKIEWVEEIVRACDKAGVAVFLKDNLEPLWTLENRREPFFKFSRPSPGATEVGKLRQEMPK